MERLVKGAALGGVVNGLLDEPELGQQLCARVPAQRHRPGIRHLRRERDSEREWVCVRESERE